MPAATASASFRTRTELKGKASDSRTPRCKPFSCCRLGHSSIRPSRMIPGAPIPIAEISAPSAAFSISRRRKSPKLPAGISASASPRSPSSGYRRMGPRTRLSSTRPTATLSPAIRTPIACRMIHLELAELVQAVERGRFIALCQSGIVEDCVHKILHGPFERHDSLSDVKQLAGSLAYDMHAEDLFGFAVEDQLQPPGGVAANLTSCNFAIIRDSHFVRDVVVGKLLFGLADERYLRNGVDPVRI